MQKTYTLGDRTFVLDRGRAEAALAAKRVVGGRETTSFNLLPLRYGWAYDLYRTMKANHWEPEDVPMGGTWSSGARAGCSPTSTAGSSGWGSATSRPPRGSWATTSSTWCASWSPRPS